MKKHLIFLVALIIALVGTAHADFYVWEDESGATHMTDYPPPQNQKNQNIKTYKGDSGQVSGTQDEQQTPKAERKPNIILYTKNDCPDCDKAREFLNSKKLAYTEYNMDNNQTAATKRKEIDNSDIVPFAIINTSRVYGFSEAIYNQALKPSL